MRLSLLTHSVIGLIYDQILILTNRQVVLMGLSTETHTHPMFYHHDVTRSLNYAYS